MGWWSIEDSPKILPSGQKEPLVNGDGPADDLTDSLKKVLIVVGFITEDSDEEMEDQVGDRVSQEEIDDLFLRRIYPESFPPEYRQLVLDIVEKGWKDIYQEYQGVWEREPFPEEILDVHNFVANIFHKKKRSQPPTT
jgi:hypothetical protein